MKIFILDDYPDAVRHLSCWSMLKDHDVHVLHSAIKDIDTLASALHGAEVLILTRERTRLSKELLQRLPKLKLVASICRVGPHIDTDACARQGVAVADGGPGYSPATVELTWALILASMRKLCLEDRRMREGRWQTSLGIGCLAGRTLGIYGYGRLGKMVASIAPAFAMSVLVFGSQHSQEKAKADGHNATDDRTLFFSTADIISIHLRLNPETRGIITSRDFALMKPDALFVNVSRSDLIEPGALLRAMELQRPGYAAVDVWDEEPVLGSTHPFTKMDNVVCSPHLGYVDKDSYEKYFAIAFQNILDFAAGTPSNLITQ